MTPRALVTGASSGIGKALATELAKRGWKLVLVARDEQKLVNLAEGLVNGPHEVLCGDLSTDSGMFDVCARIDADLEPVTLLVTAAGSGNKWPQCRRPLSSIQIAWLCNQGLPSRWPNVTDAVSRRTAPSTGKVSLKYTACAEVFAKAGITYENGSKPPPCMRNVAHCAPMPCIDWATACISVICAGRSSSKGSSSTCCAATRCGLGCPGCWILRIELALWFREPTKGLIIGD